MTASVKLQWTRLTFKAHGVSGWKGFKQETHIKENSVLLSDRAVYVIRVQRPFSFTYGEKHSPVAYIGKGQFQNRITSHLKSWIGHLSRRFPELKVDIYFCEPRVRHHGTICEGVEADLIARFVKHYGDRPLRNRNTPTDPYDRAYASEDLKILHPGRGGGWEWELSPLPSSHFYRS